MAAAWKAAWATFLMTPFIPSTHALVSQHSESEGGAVAVAQGTVTPVTPVFQADPADWSGGTASWTDAAGGQTSTIVSGVTKETKDGRPSVLLYGDSAYVEWANFQWGTDVYAEVSLEVFVYVNSYWNNLNWFAGAQPTTHCMRYILLKDDRVGGAGPSCMGHNQGGYDVGALPLNTWVQVVAVYLSDGTEYVVVDGVQSPTRTTSGGTTTGKYFRLGNPLRNHGTDANAGMVRIYDRALTLSEIQASREAFTNPTTTVPATTTVPVTTTMPAPAAGAASAVGDPHLTNVHGERFDLMQAGSHVLMKIPRKFGEATLLRVDAVAERMGGQCADIYFQELNITGKWADAKQTGGLHYQAQEPSIKPAHWERFGPVQLKVTHGHTVKGNKYLNFYVKNLGHTGYVIGGLLGEDDHSEAEKSPKACLGLMAL